MKDEFLKILKTVKREGMDEFIKFLESTDFFTAPASTRFHGDYAGGLVEHSMKVYEILVQKVKNSPIQLNISEDTLKIVALLHDVCKNFNEEECDLYLRYYDQDKLKAPLPIKHGYVAAYFLKEKCNYCQKDVLRAIYHHSDGDYNSKLGMIIYIADKREPLRNLNDGLLELSLNNLYEGFRLLK